MACGCKVETRPPVFNFGYRGQFVVFFLLGDLGITQKKEYDIQSTAKILNED
jgi:hypothetical protein